MTDSATPVDTTKYTHRVISEPTGGHFWGATSEAHGYEMIAQHTAALEALGMSESLPLIVVPRMTLSRSGTITTVRIDDVRVATITRESGSNSSPRGGAYRYFYYVRMEDGTKFNADYTRKESIETIERELARRAKR